MFFANGIQIAKKTCSTVPIVWKIWSLVIYREIVSKLWFWTILWHFLWYFWEFLEHFKSMNELQAILIDPGNYFFGSLGLYQEISYGNLIFDHIWGWAYENLRHETFLPGAVLSSSALCLSSLFIFFGRIKTIGYRFQKSQKTILIHRNKVLL